MCRGLRQSEHDGGDGGMDLAYNNNTTSLRMEKVDQQIEMNPIERLAYTSDDASVNLSRQQFTTYSSFVPG